MNRALLQMLPMHLASSSSNKKLLVDRVTLPRALSLVTATRYSFYCGLRIARTLLPIERRDS